MNKKLICTFLFLAICLPFTAFAESDPEAKPTDPAEEAGAAPTQESGNGWKTIRTVELGNSGKKVHLVLVEQNRHTDKTIYSNAIKRLCKTEDEFCRVRFWSSERYIPERAALTAEQNKQLKADFLFNKTAGINHLLWSCGVDPNSQNCLN